MDDRDRRVRRAPRAARWIGLALVLLVSLPVILEPRPAEAADGVSEITWAHPSASQVRNFVLYVSPVEGSIEATRQIDLGKPTGEGGGFLVFFSAIVPIDATDFVAVAAVGHDGRVSGLSAWGQPQPSQPGQPLVVQP